MPYIPKSLRACLDDGTIEPINPGDLNYKITSICLDYLDVLPPSYRAMNEIIGVLECVKQEFYRRVVVPYKEQKILENGDIL